MNLQLITHMLENSNKISEKAYSGMKLENHKWNKSTSLEVDFIIMWDRIIKNKSFNNLSKLRILDLGCGIGRHSIELARRSLDFNITGIDINKSLIKIAKAEIQEFSNVFPNLKFTCEDARNFESSEKFDLILCLYDVIGSHTEEESNQQLLNTVSENLKNDGIAFISVMSYEYTKNIAKNFYFSQHDLVTLPISSIQENNGNVFDPDYFVLDNKTKIVYRKEKINDEILLVKDKRFTIIEFKRMCKKAGLWIYLVKSVKAGNWNEDLGESKGKELLFVVVKENELF